jgi:hypothetical protein
MVLSIIWVIRIKFRDSSCSTARQVPVLYCRSGRHNTYLSYNGGVHRLQSEDFNAKSNHAQIAITTAGMNGSTYFATWSFFVPLRMTRQKYRLFLNKLLKVSSYLDWDKSIDGPPCTSAVVLETPTQPWLHFGKETADFAGDLSAPESKCSLG